MDDPDPLIDDAGDWLIRSEPSASSLSVDAPRRPGNELSESLGRALRTVVSWGMSDRRRFATTSGPIMIERPRLCYASKLGLSCGLSASAPSRARAMDTCSR